MAGRTFEEYLKAIYILEDERETVIAARLAEFLGVSAPTVSQMVRRLRGKGYIRVGEDRVIRLTPKGDRIAESLVRRHRLLERWLCGVLNLDWATADEEAHRLEGSISDVVEARLSDHLGDPATCPHGNPIPRPGMRARPRFEPLSQVEAGETVVVERISELAEEAVTLLNYLGSMGIVPGARFTVQDSNPHAGAITLMGKAGTVAISRDTAAMVHVRPAG